MSDYNLLTLDQLIKENQRLSDVIDKLEKHNIKLENELNDYNKYTSRCSPPNKSYKELEEELALAENSKQTAIDELYETKIGPLQNKVKDQHIQLESQYKRETRYLNNIKELEALVKNQQTIINYAAGYISACEQFRDKHPNDVVKWLFEGLT